MPITCQAFYERLKARNVVVLPGHHFFPGLPTSSGIEEWRHRHECLRVSYAQEDAAVRAGIQIIAEEARQAYGA